MLFYAGWVMAVEPRPIESDELVWVQLSELENYPMGKVDRQIANRLTAEGPDLGL